MISKQETDLVITPATWPQQVSTLQKTSTGLLNMVGWFGSTHTSAMWRKANEFVGVFQDRKISGFDPQVEDWDPTFAATEAEVMANASVIVIRLENNELLNGSLGSIAETGLALTSAALRGQIIIVSVEGGLLTTLDEPGAIAMYMVLEMALENLSRVEAVAHFFQVHRGNDLQELAVMACRAAQQQMKKSLEGYNFDQFLTIKHERRQHTPIHVLVGGSGGPYANVHHDIFYKKRKLQAAPYLSKGYIVKDLSEGALSQAWSIPYGSTDNIAIALSMRTLLTIELEAMQEADMLLLPIFTEAASVAPATKIGFLLLYALTTGQDIKILLEPFDPIDYIHQQTADEALEGDISEKSIRQMLQQIGVSDSDLAIADREEVFEAFKIIKAVFWLEGKDPSFRQIKRSLLGKTEVCRYADNIRRVRALVQAHLERIQKDERFPDFFSYFY